MRVLDKSKKMKKCSVLLLFFFSTLISAIGQSTSSKEPLPGKSSTVIANRPSSTVDNLEQSKISEVLMRLRKLENENLQLKQQLNELEKKYLSHTHAIGGFIGTGFQLTDKLSPGTWIAIPFAANGEEMQRNKKTGYPVNE